MVSSQGIQCLSAVFIKNRSSQYNLKGQQTSSMKFLLTTLSPGGLPQSRPVSRGPVMMAAQKSLPPTPALTPAMQHRQNGVTPAMAIQSAMVGNPMMQQGMAVGAGEMPNGAGPFVNGGLHNTSDDSIMMGSSASNRVGETLNGHL